jgi:crotonobetainyl-CoA:carnitine CoA-transferase CaiB-like acyl-CoA transferase
MKIGVALVDITTGLMAAISLLSGLEDRRRTGRGRRFEVSLHDTSLTMLANVAANHLISGENPARYGNGHPNIVPYRTFRASDGEVAVAVGNDGQFHKLAELVGHPEWSEDERFATNAGRVRNRVEIDGLVGEAFALHPRAHWVAALKEAGIPVGPINSVSEALTSEQSIARRLVTQVTHPVTGTFPVVTSPLRWGEEPAPVRFAPPRLGEHTESVLTEELGLSLAEVAELRSAGVV